MASRNQRFRAARPDDAPTPVVDSLRFNVSQLLQESFGITRQYALNVPPQRITEGLETSEPLRGLVRMTRTNRGLFVEVDVQTTVSVECARCLETAYSPMRLTFAEEFHPVIDILTGLPVRDEYEPDDFRIDENQELDVGEAVRQYALASLPMQILCRPDCAGLCPECGKDRNLGPCACRQADEEPPRGTGLGALREWLERNDDSKSDKSKHDESVEGSGSGTEAPPASGSPRRKRAR